MSFPRLRDILGAPIDDATFEQILGLVKSGAEEHFDLDFKRSLYAHKAAEGADLAKDVAALANSLGGVIVLGIREENGAAVEATPVEFSEPEELWMQQKIASLVFPKPTWRLRRVPDPSDPSRGFCLCIVPRSRVAPHAVVDGISLKYFVRDQKSNRPLAEHEVAERYRERFVRGTESNARLAQVLADGRAGWRPPEFFLEMALVPLDPGELKISYGELEFIKERIWRRPQEHHLRRDIVLPATGLRRICLRGAKAREREHELYYGELHGDGAGYLGVSVFPRATKPPPMFVRQWWFVHDLAEQLSELTHHAIRSGSTGDALAVSRFTTSSGKPPTNVALAPLTEFFEGEDVPAARGPFESRHTVTLERTELESMLAVRSILTDLVQAFGFPEVEMINSDGTIPRELWRRATGEEPVVSLRRRGSFPADVIR
jgi:hypothetical protein